jgi:DNA invertase Pin-like site-specific DNA recombinase
MREEAKPNGNRGVAYIRVSDGDRQDPERQRQTIRTWAEKRGLTISHWFEDVKGRNARDRSEDRINFQKLIKDIEANKVPWVVVDSQDRWGTAKHAFEFGKWASLLIEHDCQLWSVNQGHLTAPDAATAFTTTAGSVTSTEELKKFGERQVSGKRTKALSGQWQGGYVPYGFDVVCQDSGTGVERWRVAILKMIPTKGKWHRVRIYPDGKQERCDGKDRFPRKQDWEVFKLAPTVITERITTAQEIFKLFSSGAWSVRGLCNRLNERKIDPVIGEGWYGSRLKPMLSNPAFYIGSTVWGKLSHGKNAQYVGGEYIVPPKKNGKATTGRKNAESDWVFPPLSTAVVDKSIWDEVQVRLKSTKLNIKRGLRDDRLWLAGLLICGTCGQRMTGNAQGLLNYRCTSYVKFGKNNPYGCKLHRVPQSVIEPVINEYLDTIAPEVKELLPTKDNPNLLAPVHAKLATREQELWGVFGAMRKYLDEKGIKVSKEEGELPSLLDTYLNEYAKDQDKLQVELTEKEAELKTLLVKLIKMPDGPATQMVSQMIDEVNREVAELRQKLIPLNTELDTAYADLEALDKLFTEAQEAAPGDDGKRKALTVRKVVERIILHFDHTTRPATDRRSKAATVESSVLSRLEFIPVTGHSFTVDNEQGLTIHIESLLTALLTRTICPEIKAKRKTTSEKVRELKAQGKRPTEIARLLGISRKSVDAVLNTTVKPDSEWVA